MNLKSSLFLITYCRPGFEKDCASELRQRYFESAVFSNLTPQAGWLKVEWPVGELRQVRSADLVFSRQVFIGSDTIRWQESDRVTPMVSEVVRILGEYDCELLYHQFVVEYPDTNEGKSLSRFAKKLEKPIENGLKRAGFKRVYSRKDLPKIHFFLLGYQSGIAGISFPEQSSAFPMGIPRLKTRSDAPSRSALKLEEALLYFLSEQQQTEWFGEGMYAVDLGAAPGGWTGELVRRGVFVTAVDHGSLDHSLMATGMVDHVREDAFKFRPKRPVDWLVCDMVEKPSRVVSLLLDWLKQGWFQYAVVNLKLPMKMKFDELQSLMTRIETLGTPLGLSELRAKHLYHDREEVTLFLTTK